MAKKLPIYDLHAFQAKPEHTDFYCNVLNTHVQQHAFTNLPHKHDFYLTMIVTKGSGWHEIDFVRYEVKKGSVFVMQPGQMHYWKLSSNINGYVFFHTKEFYNEGYTMTKIHDLDFFKSFQCEPSLYIPKAKREVFNSLMQEIMSEYKNSEKQKLQKIHALVNIVYIEFSRLYVKQDSVKKQTYLPKLHRFEELIEEHFYNMKKVSDYAELLNITEKHLNRISKDCLNKTCTQLITDRIILEAKRLLIQNKLNVSQIAYKLGYTDNSYFTRLFKKHSGETPLAFLNRYHSNS